MNAYSRRSMPASSAIMKSVTADDVQPSRYRVVNRIGAGGMGEAYLAVMQCVGGATKPVVLKRLWPALAANPNFVAMFLDEARLSLRLNHPNVVHAYEVGWQDDGYYLAMEHIEGMSLKEVVLRLAPDGALALPLVIEIVSRVLAGLDYVHNLTDVTGRPLGIIHRDVSPHNVFITYDGAVKLVDFGVATSTASKHEHLQGTVKGRLAYMAPEQARGEEIDGRADLFSGGVILWELLAGRRLWTGFNQGKLARRLRSGERVPALPVGGDIDPELAAICARALEMERGKRYASASEFQAALSRVPTLDAASAARQLGELMRHTFADSRLEIQAMIRRNTLEIDLTGFSAAEAGESDEELLDVTTAAVLLRDRFAGDSLKPATGDSRTHHVPLRFGAWAWLRPYGVWFGALAALLLVGGVLGVASTRWSAPAAPEPTPPATSSEPMATIPASAGEPPPTQESPIPEAAPTETRITRTAREIDGLARRSVTTARPRSGDRVIGRVPVRAAGDVTPIGTRAQEQFELAVYGDALRLARQAARLAPDDARYQVLVGDASFKLGLTADAAAAYARAGMLRPGDASIRARLDRLLSAVRPAARAEEPPKRRAPSIETTDPYAADLE